MVLTLLLGTLLGIARLSSNWLVRQGAAIYVEALRNTPPLLVIIFANAAVVLGALPRITDSIDLGGLLILNNRQLAVAAPFDAGDAGLYLAVLAAGVVVALVLARWRTRLWEATGAPHHRFLWGAGAFVVIGLAGYVALGGPVGLSRAEAIERRV